MVVGLLLYALLFNRWVVPYHPISPQLYFLIYSLGYMGIRRISLSEAGLNKLWILASCVPILLYLFLRKWTDSFTLFLLAPVSEELFFRGLLLPEIRKRYSYNVSIVISAILFMFCHKAFALGPLVLGLVNGFLRKKTGTIWAGMATHSASNTLLPILRSFTPQIYRWISPWI